MRKVNFAASVNEKTPPVDAVSWLDRANYSNNSEFCLLLFAWTGIQVCGIIICT